jgi:hypothetical protein
MVMTGATALRAILAVACCLGPAACGSRHALMAAPASSASAATPHRGGQNQHCDPQAHHDVRP